MSVQDTPRNAVLQVWPECDGAGRVHQGKTSGSCAQDQILKAEPDWQKPLVRASAERHRITHANLEDEALQQDG
eukprot:9130359-Pyramimonas_sp.AAC.1